MDQFVSAFTNKIDTKGRVSVPASFRSVLAKDGLDGIYCYPSLDAPALDAGGMRLVDKINSLVEEIPPYSDERDHLANGVLCIVVVVPFGTGIDHQRDETVSGVPWHALLAQQIGDGGQYIDIPHRFSAVNK